MRKIVIKYQVCSEGYWVSQKSVCLSCRQIFRPRDPTSDISVSSTSSPTAKWIKTMAKNEQGWQQKQPQNM